MKPRTPQAPALFPLLLTAAAVAAPSLSAQAPAITVTVVDKEHGAPVSGVWLTLLPVSEADEAAEPAYRPPPASRGISNHLGQARLPASAPGTYVVRAERIGLRTAVSAPLELEEGERAVLRLELPPEVISLGAIDVEATGRPCVLRPEEGARTASLWGEARKALDLLEFTQEEGIYRYLVLTRESILDPMDLRTRDEAWDAAWYEGAVPFDSQPAEDLARNGFIQTTDDGTFFYAPDASVLLSDPFLDAHCFRVLPGHPDEPGLIGLGFEPVPTHPAPALNGALWLDSATAELRFAEFRYTDVPGPPDDRVRGRVEFDRLPEGTWIVRRWWIRAPAVHTSVQRGLIGRGRESERIVGFLETGGEVVDLLPRQGPDGDDREDRR